MAVAVEGRNPRFRVRAVTRTHGEIPPEAFADSVVEIVTHKRMGEAAGGWQLVLVPRRRAVPGAVGAAGWEDAFQSMDWVELELWVPPREPRVVMRGFVDAVHESFSIGSGRPARFVVVAGRDYGKLLLLTKLWFPDSVANDVEILKRWFDFVEGIWGWGQRANPSPVGTPGTERRQNVQFAPTEILFRIWNEFLEPQQDLVLEELGGGIPRMLFSSEFEADALKTWNPAFFDERVTTPYIDVWALMAAYQHSPWRELFVSEGDGASPVLFYRATPWLDISGQPVQGQVTEVEVGPAESLVRRSLTRSEREIHNLFLTIPGGGFGALHSLVHRYPGTTASALEGFYAGRRFEGNPFLLQPGQEPFVLARQTFRSHGFRPMTIKSAYFDIRTDAEDQEIRDRLREIRELGLEDNLKLVRALNHMGYLEEGVFSLKGDERLRIGDYLRLGPGGPRYYLAGVAHRLRVATQEQDGHFYTDAQVTRGRGHLEKVPPFTPPTAP